MGPADNRTSDFLRQAGFSEQVLQPVVENMPRRTRHLRPRHDEVTLSLALSSHRNRRMPPNLDIQTEAGAPDFVNGLLERDAFELKRMIPESVGF